MASRKVKLDMTGVESYTRCPEGNWLAKLVKIEVGEVQGSGDDALKAQFEVIKGSAKGCTVFETFSLAEKALWKLKSFLEAIGVKATGKISLDLDKLQGKICMIDVIHDEYNGTKRAKISSYEKPEDEDDDDEEDEDEEDEDEEDDEEEEPAPKKTSKKSSSTSKKTSEKKAPAKKSSKKAEPEDDDDEDEDDWEEDD